MRILLTALLLVASVSLVPTGSAREQCGYGPWESVVPVDTNCCADWAMGGCWNDKCSVWATTVVANEVCVQSEDIT